METWIDRIHINSDPLSFRAGSFSVLVLLHFTLWCSVTLSCTQALLKATGTLFCSCKADRSAAHFLSAPVQNELCCRLANSSNRFGICSVSSTCSPVTRLLLCCQLMVLQSTEMVSTGGGVSLKANQAAKWSTAIRVTPQDIFKDTCGHFQLFRVDQNRLCLTDHLHPWVCRPKYRYFKPNRDVSRTQTHMFSVPKTNQSIDAALWQERKRKCNRNRKEYQLFIEGFNVDRNIANCYTITLDNHIYVTHRELWKTLHHSSPELFPE